MEILSQRRNFLTGHLTMNGMLEGATHNNLKYEVACC